MDNHSFHLESIIHSLEHDSAEILHLCQNVPVATLSQRVLPNGWSIKDVLAHLAAWNWRSISLLAAAHHRDWPLKANPDVEGLNREFYQERKGWSWNEVKTDFCRAHQGLIRAIEALPPERRGSDLIRETIVEDVLEHYRSHLSDMECWCEASIERNGQIR